MSHLEKIVNGSNEIKYSNQMFQFKVYLKYRKYVTYPRSNKCKEYPGSVLLLS